MLRLLTIAACALVAGGGFAIPRLGFAASAPPDKAAALQRLGSVATTDSNTEPVAPPDAVLRPLSARMLGPDSPLPIPPSVLRVRNGWLVSDGRTLVAVYAGAAGNDPSVGRLVIVRQDLASGEQTVRSLDAGATGALVIVAAPLGNAAETSARTRGLRVRTSGGGVLRLELGAGGSAAVDAPTSHDAHETRLRWLSRPTRSSDQAPYPKGR